MFLVSNVQWSNVTYTVHVLFVSQLVDCLLVGLVEKVISGFSASFGRGWPRKKKKESDFCGVVWTFRRYF